MAAAVGALGLRLIDARTGGGDVALVAVEQRQRQAYHAVARAQPQRGQRQRHQPVWPGGFEYPDTSGGSAMLALYLQNLLEGEILPLPVDEDARLNNVFGYWKYGQHIWPAA